MTLHYNYKKRPYYWWPITDGPVADSKDEVTDGQADGNPSVRGRYNNMSGCIPTVRPLVITNGKPTVSK